MERAQAREGRDARPGGTMAAVGSMGTGSGSEWDAVAVDVRPGGAPRAIGRVAENSRRRHRAGQMRQGPRRGGSRRIVKRESTMTRLELPGREAINSTEQHLRAVSTSTKRDGG